MTRRSAITALLPMSLLLAVLALVGAPAGPAHAATRDHLRLLSQTTWATPHQPFNISVRVTGPVDPAHDVLELAVFGRLITRTAFSETEQGRDLGALVWSAAPTLDAMPQGPDGTYDACIPVDALPTTACPAPEGLLINGVAGVYPLQVSLRSGAGGTELAHFTTHLVVGPGRGVSPKLGFALIVPVQARRPLLVDGARFLSAGTTGRLDRLAGELAAERDGMALTLEPDPSTLAALGDTPTRAAVGALAGLRRLVAGLGVQTLGRPFAPVAPYDLTDAGLASELAAQVARGGKIEATEIVVAPAPGTWVLTGPVDHGVAAALRSLGTGRLVIPVADLSDTGTTRTPADPYLLDAGGSDLPALVEDRELASDLSGSDPVLAGHELLADLAQVYFEQPNEARGVVAVAPADWDPARAFLDVVGRGLADSPIVASSTVDGLLNSLPAPDRTRDPAQPVRRSNLPAGRIRADRARQLSLESAAVAGLPAAVSMNDLVLAAETAGLSGRQRAAYLAGAEHTLATQLSQVRVEVQGITLTSRHQRVPISVQSLLAVPLDVRVHLSSDALTFKGGGNQVTLPERLALRNTTFSIPVETRATGGHPLQVDVRTADGRLLVTTAQLYIKSTAFSGVGIGLSAGALLFLAVWWGRELRAGRRRRNPRLVDPDKL